MRIGRRRAPQKIRGDGLLRSRQRQPRRRRRFHGRLVRRQIEPHQNIFLSGERLEKIRRFNQHHLARRGHELGLDGIERTLVVFHLSFGVVECVRGGIVLRV